jgi:hypothetical protein
MVGSTDGHEVLFDDDGDGIVITADCDCEIALAGLSDVEVEDVAVMRAMIDMEAVAFVSALLAFVEVEAES